MNWLSFFVGVLVGWIVEWFIDIFYWRRKYQACQTEKDALETRLNEAERRIRIFQVKGREEESEPQRTPLAHLAAGVAGEVPSPDVDLGVDLKAPEVALPDADLDVDLKAPEVSLPDADLDVDLKAPELALPEGDLDVDLKAPEVALPDVDLGVDLKAPEVKVPDTGFDAFFDGLKARFPDVDLDGSIDRLKARFPDLDLKTALDGLKADFPDLDLDGAFDSLRAKFPDLDGDVAIAGVAPELGERRAKLPTIAPQRPDDLKRIEGIGPKISRLLKDNGILTFAQLANTSIDRLRAILLAGGPNFQLADPTTWPEQAKLAADEAWDELQALQDRLIGGRKSRRRDR